MTKRIFRSILLAVTAVLVACLIIVMGVLYNYFASVSEAQIKAQTLLVARAVENEGESFLRGFDSGSYRITWISSEGSVLFDTDSDTSAMTNHSDREEFIEAKETGLGESARYSDTLTERMLYCAKRLSDGSVIRVAGAESSVLALALGILQPVFIVLVIAIILSAVLASRLAKRIVSPLNSLNLDTPLDNDSYEELSPLLMKIERQHREIEAKMQDLHRREEEWDAVAGSMNEGIVLLNEDNLILNMNKSAMRILSADEQALRKSFISVCRHLDIQSLLERSAKGEKAECISELFEREFQVFASPIKSGDKVQGTALLFFDITEKARAEQMRREFTANVSHELKTPLHTISGTSEIIMNGLVEPEDLKSFIERIYSESQRMITLVDDIIRLSGLDEGAGKDEREKLSLMALANDAVKRLSTQAKAKKVSITLDGGEGNIEGVSPLVSELIFNLIDNAIKYNREGGFVKVKISDTDKEAVLSVLDNGIGIPSESLDRVFERFYRVDKSHSKEIGGTGLGLSIVKHVARLHGARLELNSKPQKGTEITVSFPK